MKITKEKSEVIDMLRFPLIVGVVLLHSYITKVGLSSGGIVGGEGGVWSNFIQDLFSQVFARIAVPLFFLFSGLLLFQGKKLTIDLISEKWKSRLFTLLLPFIVWNTADLMIQIFGQTIPVTSHFFTGKTFDVSNLSPKTLWDAYFDFRSYPVNAPLWFLRDLIVLVIFSPVLYFLIRKTGWYIIMFFLFAWFGFFFGTSTFFLLSNEAVFFFSLGLFLSICEIDKFEEELRKTTNAKIIIGIYLLSAFLEVNLKHQDLSVFLLHKVNIILGVVAIFIATHVWIRTSRFGTPLLYLAPISYFVYLAHNSLLQVFKKLSYVIFKPNNDISFILIYFLAPLLTISSLFGIYCFLQYVSPVTLNILLGRFAPRKNSNKLLRCRVRKYTQEV